LYPFGLKHKGYNNGVVGSKNNYKTYQGQEFTEDLNLNWYEWRFRFSDPSLGRFISIDPLAEDYVYNSTYAFQENKMGLGIELEGLEMKRLNAGSNKAAKAASNAFYESINPKREMEIKGIAGEEAARNAKRERKEIYKKNLKDFKGGAEEAALGGINEIGSKLSDSGGLITIGSIVLAPFTGGTSLTLLPLAAQLSTTGTIITTSVDVYDENYESAGKKVLQLGFGKGLGKLSDKGIKAVQKYSELTKNETMIHQGIFATIGVFFKKTFNTVVNGEEGEEGEEEKE